MRVFEYMCLKCESLRDVDVAEMNPDYRPVCLECGCEDMVRKYSFGVSFKGSGFYKTDK